MPVLWTESARRDLAGIGDYIALRSPQAALRFMDELFARTAILETAPRSGRIVPEYGRENIRELIHGNYRIVYQLRGEEALVLTVFEGHKLLP